MIRNLVYNGGGILGAAYPGTDVVLENKGILKGIEKVAGTSAGAIFALLQSLKFTAKEKFTIFESLDFSSFQDGNILDKVRVFETYGIHPGDVFLSWCKKIINSKGLNPNATFKDFKYAGYLDLHTFAVSMDRGLVEHSYQTTPDVSVCDAIRASMAIPIFFDAHEINGEYFVDGGLQNNYPINCFDTDNIPNPETLGFHLGLLGVTPELSKLQKGQIKEYCLRLFEQERNQQMIDLMSEPEDIKRTVFIDTIGISATNFNCSTDEEMSLFKSGLSATESKLLHFPNILN